MPIILSTSAIRTQKHREIFLYANFKWKKGIVQLTKMDNSKRKLEQNLWMKSLEIRNFDFHAEFVRWCIIPRSQLWSICRLHTSLFWSLLRNYRIDSICCFIFLAIISCSSPGNCIGLLVVFQWKAQVCCLRCLSFSSRSAVDLNRIQKFSLFVLETFSLDISFTVFRCSNEWNKSQAIKMKHDTK